MKKKLWSNAEVVELGVESTREDSIPCPEEPTTLNLHPGGWPNDRLICSYPGCTHLVWKGGPNCYCHRNSSLPGGGEPLPSQS